MLTAGRAWGALRRGGRCDVCMYECEVRGRAHVLVRYLMRQEGGRKSVCGAADNIYLHVLSVLEL